MREYLIELSKYFITGFMILYAISCLVCFFVPEGRGKKGIYLLQNMLMFLVQVFCFFDLTVLTRDIQYLFLFAFVQVFLFVTLLMVTMIYEKCNRLLLNNMCMLLGVGLMMISRLSFDRAIRQYVIVLLSLMVSLMIPFLFSEVRFLKKMTWLYGAVGITLLGIVLFMGELTHGSNISIEILGVTFQPSEFVKILYIFFLAGALWENTSFPRVAVTALLAGIHVLLLVCSTDLGGALIYFTAYVFVVLTATGNYLYLLLGALGGGGAAMAAYKLFSHVRVRVLAWRDPWRYIDDQGYQITQSLFAIGGGSWFGMGLLKGNPTAIPYVSADFIFSSICEELGVIFGICLIFICVGCFVTIMQIALRIYDRFYQIIVYGIGTMYIFQIFLTVGGGIKFIPLTGVTLPFVSYGGSSVMSTMIMFFIIQGIYIRLQQEGADRVVRAGKQGERAKGKGRKEDQEA